jgi:hypothetical protein
MFFLMKANKGCGSKFLRGKRILLVEVSNLALSVSKICCRFSEVRAFFIAFPFYSVLKLLTEDIGIYDFIDFVFLFIFHCNRVRQWRFVKAVVSIESKTVNIENWMELQIVW